MCGITGVLDFNNSIEINQNLLTDMSSCLNFRGPDKDGYFTNKSDKYSIGLAHTRLSIIDLSNNGDQPMRSHDGKLIIVFNGEIYNYIELKKVLQKEGAIFKSNSDTEVILAAYEHWGIDKCLDMIEGMFAFGLFNFELNTLILARDRFGEKPLYFFQKKNTIGFSSDIRSFNYLPIEKTINKHALGYYLAEMCTPIGDSIWNEINKLPPGNYLSFSSTQLKVVEYWNLNYRNKIKTSINDVIPETENLIVDSVKKRLVSDVPVGCFLSGGIDSSLVSLFAAQNYHGRIKTFSVGFEYEKFNELPYAKIVAEKINSEHHEIILNPNDLKSIDSLLDEYGEPFADSSQIPTYFISKFASEFVKVVLGGDGGDELFGGYRTYNQALRMNMWYRLKMLKPIFNISYKLSKFNKFNYLSGIMNKDSNIIGSALFRSMGFSNTELKYLINDPELITAANKENSTLIENAQYNTNTIFDSILHASIKSRLVNDYLVKTDRASMYNSLELRTPFLDRNLIEYLSALPSNYIINKRTNKYLTKKIAENYFDKKFIYRDKQGFSIPIGEWMKKEWKKEVIEVLNYNNPFVELNKTYINQLFKEHTANIHDHTHKIWILYVLNKWSMRNS